MWRLIHDFLKWAPAALCGSALAIAAIWEGAKNWIGSLVALGWTQMSDPWVAAFVLFFVLTYVVAIMWTGKRAARNFEVVSEWSVSIDLGCMASSHEDGKMTRYIRDMCRFVNLSTSQSRLIDLTVTIPHLDRSKPPANLYTTRRLPIDDVRIGPVLAARFDPFLSFPIRIEPNEAVEGRIEFEVPAGVESDDLDLFRAWATVREARAHKSKRIYDGNVYDALKQKMYRGAIGAPSPVWGPRLQRIWRRLRGHRLPPARTIGQMTEDGSHRMAEIQQELAEPKGTDQHEKRLFEDELARQRAAFQAKAQLMRDRLATRNHSYGDARFDTTGSTSYLAAMWDAEQRGHFYDEYHRSTFMPHHKESLRLPGDTIAEVQRNLTEDREKRRQAAHDRSISPGDK